NDAGHRQAAAGEAPYRDMLKDQGQAASREQEQRQLNSEDVATQLLAQYEARREQNPADRRLLRSIAALYTQKKAFDRALEYLSRAASTAGGPDPSLDKAVIETRVKKLEHEIQQLDPDDPLSA